MRNYHEFLETKRHSENNYGFDVDNINPMLYDFQTEIVRWALRKGRAAIFADCGLGKTPMQLEWAQKIVERENKPVLILAPLAVSLQTKREGKKFNIDVNVCRSQKDIINGINITNYEILEKFDPGCFVGIVLDESSILKNFTGKYRNQIIQSFNHTPYRLACTATPAPNDYMELGNHAEFLGILARSEMLSMFFINDTSNVGTWKLKWHSRKIFWEWLCSWSVMFSKPSDIGFDDDGFILPRLNIIEKIIEYGKPLSGKLFVEAAETLSERRNARKETINIRCDFLADKINSSKEKWIVWCNLNAESKYLTKKIEKAVQITGSDSIEHKENSMIAFANGDIDVLITKPKIAGFGMNWQICSNVAFAGFSDSYESYYQAVRRCWRFGQKKEVNVYIVVSKLETNVLENVKRKQIDSFNMRDEMVKNMSDISKVEIRHESKKESEYYEQKAVGDNWEIYHGDCIEVLPQLPDNSIDYCIFSPPFASLYTYSDSERDMGNCRGMDEFLIHFKFLIKNLFRVTVSGRLCSIHCMDLYASIVHNGYIGLKDFPGELIRAFEKEGWIYHSRVTIWKDPLVQAVRTKVLTLAHKQIVKDSSRCAQGMADYIVTFRKPGDNPKPIAHPNGFNRYVGTLEFPKGKQHEDQRKNKQSHEIWQRYASPVWFDINQTRVLPSRLAKNEKDEKHICPLQLDVIERCLELWSNPGEKILDPFNGIGSTIFCAVEAERYGIGIELKESYFLQSLKNMETLKYQKKQRSLF